MINFSEEHQPEEPFRLSKAKIAKLVEALAGQTPFYEGSYHQDLTPLHITEIIKHLMFAEGNQSIQIIIDKEPDQYHLALTIDKKEK